MKAITIVGAVSLLALPLAAHAQTVTGRETDTGVLSPVGATLDDVGIRIRSQLIDEFAANPVGGVEQSYANVGQFQIGASLDLDKMIGVDGGHFDFTFLRDYGTSLSKDHLGTFAKVQENYKNQFHIWRLGLIAYNQKLFNDHLNLLVGRLGTTSLYGRLTNTCYFQSGLTCSVPQILNSSADFTKATSATWGGNVRYNFSSGSYLQAGAFEVNSFIQHTNGFDWSTSQATGVVVPFELGIGAFDLAKRRYPSTVKFGGYVSTAPFNNPFSNTKGESIALNGGKALASSQLRSGIYAMGEKTVWRPAAGSDRSLSVFGGWVLPLENNEVMRAQVYGGAALRAPFASRPHDIVSFEANYFRVSDREQAFLRDSRIKAGGHGINNPNEYFFEAAYSTLAARGVRLSPNVQYIVNPDNSALPKAKDVPKNAIVLGMKLSINVASFLGLPLAPALSD